MVNIPLVDLKRLSKSEVLEFFSWKYDVNWQSYQTKFLVFRFNGVDGQLKSFVYET